MLYYRGKKYDRIALFGAGSYFAGNRRYLDPEISFCCYADNDSSKWGKDIYKDGIECISPEELKAKEVDFLVIGVQKGKNRKELAEHAKKMGFRYCYLDELIDDYIDIYHKGRVEEEKKTVAEFFKNKKQGHRIILLNTPEITSTIGDHAIATSEILFLKKHFSQKEIIEIGDRFFWKYKEEIKRYIYPSDILLIQGGGYMGSLWRMYREDTIRYILQAYKENRIVILPQTMFFEDTEDGRKQLVISREIYNSHKKLAICFREKNSYDFANSVLEPHVERYLIPDTVLSMSYEGELPERKGIAICFKNDKETLWTTGQQEHLIDDLKKRGFQIKIITMFYSEQISSARERENVIREKMKELAGYELVITDAMHGMVLSAVSGTPCIGVESITGKVGGIYKWLDSIPYVEYVRDSTNIRVLVEDMLKQKDTQYNIEHLQPFFQKLKEIIEGIND